MVVGLGSAGLLVGLLSGRQDGRWFMPALALLAGFYAGTWLNSPHHSFAGDAVVLILATVPACVSAALGSAVGPHLASRQRERKTRNDLPRGGKVTQRSHQQRGRCPVCERLVALTAEGEAARHNGTIRAYAPPEECPGGGQGAEAAGS